MRKGLSQTIYLVVVAIVILIVALVLLTIFGGGMANITSITQAENICRQKAATSCSATQMIDGGQMPVDWNVPFYEGQSCKALIGDVDCGQILKGESTQP